MTTETLTNEELEKMTVEEVKPYVNSTYAKIAQLMGVVTKVHKDKTNDFHHYSYASNVAVLSAVREEMVKLKLIYIPEFDIEDSSSDKTSYIVKVHGKIVDAETGDFITVTALGAGSDKGDKHVQKGMTAADKYLWLKFLMLPTPDDPEADTSTDARTAPNVSQPASLGVTGALGHVLNAKVLEVKKKNAENPKSPYTIVTDKGTYDTFDKDVIAQMSLAQASGLVTDFAFKETKWGKDIVKEKPNGGQQNG